MILIVVILLATTFCFGQNFTCNDGQVVEFVFICDGTNDCKDGTDEKPADFITYPDDPTSPYMQCSIGEGKVCGLKLKEFCKGTIICQGKNLCDAGCRTHFLCPNTSCWKRSTVCDGDPCNNCPAFQHWNNGYGFKCIRNGRKCNLPQILVHDDVADCDDGSDLCYMPNNDSSNNSRHSADAYFNNRSCFQCKKDNTIISRASVCDDIIDCSDKSDECECDGKHYDLCQNESGKQTIRSNQRCWCFDEPESCYNKIGPNITCQFSEKEVCVKYASCAGNLPCELRCPSHFQCPEKTCLKRSTVCDDDPCNDCPTLHAQPGSKRGFNCIRNGRKCELPQVLLHDQVQDCDDFSDLCFSPHTNSKLENIRIHPPTESGNFNHLLCFQCMHDSVIISKTNVCDGEFNCPDMSDECLCDTVKVQGCENFHRLPPTSSTHENKTTETNCKQPDYLGYKWSCYAIDGSTSEIDSKLLCDGKLDCTGFVFNSNEDFYFFDENTELCKHRKFCNTQNIRSINLPKSKICDGSYDCLDNSDETVSEIPPALSFKVCNGFVECADKSDEHLETCKDQGRFICSAFNGIKVSISWEEVCDFTLNCDDGSDETNCTHDGRFYCENEKPLFVKKEKKFNGIGDCTDWSDECPSVTKHTNENVFSSRYEMIGNPFLRAVVWIMALLAIGGNVVIAITELRTLTTTKNRSASFLTNHILVLNLSISDLLMGVYLLMLGIVGIHFSGNYCANDFAWRSSVMCTTMGILVMLSSETSVFTMLLLTSFRLYAVKNPFKASFKPTMKTVILAILLAWAFSFILVLIPLISRLQHLFQVKAWMKENPFFESAVVDISKMHTFTQQFVTMHHNLTYNNSVALNQALMKIHSAHSWDEYLGILNNHNYAAHFNVSGYFGFYSSNSVCISKIFVTPADKAWGYSIAITTLNCAGFVFVALTYAWIYKRSRHSSKLVNEGSGIKTSPQNKEMQKKIIRLIITDFLCWIPISVMSFLNLGGVSLPPVMYAVSAIILLPINSSLNPLVYSNTLRFIYANIKNKLLRCCGSRPNGVSRTGASFVQTQNTTL